MTTGEPNQNQPVGEADQHSRPTSLNILNCLQPFGRIALLGGLFTLAACVLAWATVSHPGFGLRGDMTLHYHIARAYAQSVAEGNWLPHWAGVMDGGHGDALFTFYPPLAYFCSVLLLKLFNLELLTALKFTTVLSLIVGQATAYYFARAFFARAESLLLALLYVALPALPFLALHRCFLANAIAFSLVPLALRGAYELLCAERVHVGLIALALGMSGVILSHVITSYLCGIAIALLLLVCWPQAGWRGVLRLTAGGGLVFALTAFFLVPQLVELPWVRVELQAGRHDYRNYLLFAAAADASKYRQDWAGLNEFASAASLAQFCLVLLCVLACWPLLRRGKHTLVMRYGVALTLFALIISLPFTAFVWRWLPGLRFIQFPWRFLPFVSLACGLIVAVARTDGRETWRSMRPRWRILLMAGLTLTLLINLGLTWASWKPATPEKTLAQTMQHLTASKAAKLSKEAVRQLASEDPDAVHVYAANHDYYRPRVAELDVYPPATQPGGLSILNGQARIISQQLRNEWREFVLNCAEPVRARLETYRYPHWVIRLDGREIEPQMEAGSGLMLVELPAGQHTLTASFEPRHWLERLARWLSACAWIGFSGWLLWQLRRVWPAICRSPAVVERNL